MTDQLAWKRTLAERPPLKGVPDFCAIRQAKTILARRGPTRTIIREHEVIRWWDAEITKCKQRARLEADYFRRLAHREPWRRRFPPKQRLRRLAAAHRFYREGARRARERLARLDAELARTIIAAREIVARGWS